MWGSKGRCQSDSIHTSLTCKAWWGDEFAETNAQSKKIFDSMRWGLCEMQRLLSTSRGSANSCAAHSEHGWHTNRHVTLVSLPLIAHETMIRCITCEALSAQKNRVCFRVNFRTKHEWKVQSETKWQELGMWRTSANKCIPQSCHSFACAVRVMNWPLHKDTHTIESVPIALWMRKKIRFASQNHMSIANPFKLWKEPCALVVQFAQKQMEKV